MPNYCCLLCPKMPPPPALSHWGKLTFMPVFTANPLYRVDSMAFSKRPAKLVPR